MASIAAIFLAGLAAPTVFRVVYRATHKTLARNVICDSTRPYMLFEQGFPTTFSKHEAVSALGALPTSSSTEIQRKYRELIKDLHSDTGGTPYIARRINEAREAAQKK